MAHPLADLAPHTADLTPEIDGARCVHARIEHARCRRCVEWCPTGAWIIDEERLGIDTERCDGCGLCAPACPEQAIHTPARPEVRRWKNLQLVLAGCGRVESVPPEARVGCVHALDLATLTEWAMQGISHLVTADAPCDDCFRHPAETLSERLSRLNRLLTDRGFVAVQHHRLPAPRWRAMWATTEPVCGTASLSRRGFLRHLSGQALERILESRLPEAEAEESRRSAPAPAKRLRARGCPGTWFLYAPHIDPLRCTACHACVRVCGHAAITLDEEAPAYELDPDACTGCGACMDVCDQDAVHIERDTESPQWTVPLICRRCRACGAPFHRLCPEEPGRMTEEPMLCPICRQVNHPSRLFQVDPS